MGSTASIRFIGVGSTGAAEDLLHLPASGERPDLETAHVEINHPAEREVVLQLVEFHPTVLASVESNQPHRLCTYLFELAQTFSRFYEECPVLGAATPMGRGRAS